MVHFSALRFLDDLPVPRQSPQRLRDLFLFALRALAVMLIATAFAWPYLRTSAVPAVSTSRVFILDNTLSNQAGGAFQQSRDDILKEIQEAGSHEQIAVIELKFQPRTVVNFGDSRQEAITAVSCLQPSFQRGSFLAAFNRANAMLAQSLGQKKEIVICSDNQENQWSENVNTPPFLKDVEVKFARQPTGTTLPNLSLQQPSATRFFNGEKTLVNFTVVLRHSESLKNAVVTLRVNRQEIFRRTVEFKGEPEEMRLLAQWESDPSLWIEGEITVEGEPDALPGDNRIFFALPPMNEGRIALLAQSPYLHAALSPDVMRGRWTTRMLQPSKLAGELNTALNEDVLVVEAGYLQSKDARDLVFRYLNNGRGVLLLLNRVTPLVKGVLSNYGFDFAPQNNRVEKDPPQNFRYIALEHPIFAPLAKGEYGSLGDIRVMESASISSKTAAPLIFSQTGGALFFDAAAPKGHLLVSAFGFDRNQTDWPVHPTFIPFIDSLLHYARGQKEMQNAYEPGETYAMEIPPGKLPGEIVLRKDGKPVARAMVDSNRRVQMPVPEEPGLYAVTYDSDPAVQTVIAVNPSPKESRLSYVMNPPTVKAWQLPDTGKAGIQGSTPAPDAASRAAILRQQLWWWLLAGAVAMLIAETGWLFFRRVQA